MSNEDNNQNEKKKIITIAGNAGAGKSSTANRVASVLDYKRFSSGDFMRHISQNRNVSLEKLHTLAETDPAIDHEIDALTKETGKNNEIVIDSRLAFHFIPNSFKVFLSLDPEISAERIFTDMQSNPQRTATEQADNTEEVLKSITERRKSNQKRYQEMYGIDYLDQSQFDLVIDTGSRDLESVAQEIIAEYKKWLAS